MTELPEDPPSEAERHALHSLYESSIPSPDLEDRVVHALGARDLLRARRASAGWPLRVAVALAASVVVFLAGAALGARLATPPRLSGPQFVLFLVEGATFHAPVPGTESARVAEYREWAHHLGVSGVQIRGEKLKEGVETLGESGTGPETSVESLGGYFIVEAKDAAQAGKIASTCPHLRHGGRVLIRQIDPV